MSRNAYDGGGIYLEASCSVPRPSGEDRAVGGVGCASQEGAGTFESSAVPLACQGGPAVSAPEQAGDPCATSGAGHSARLRFPASC